MTRQRTLLISSVVIALGTFLFHLGLQSVMRPHAINGMYFQEWSSEALMQTVPINELRRAPLESLSHIFVQPPLLDSIRAIVAVVVGGPPGNDLVRNVDKVLYVVWAALAGILSGVMFRWLALLTTVRIALAATFIFSLHPAVIFYATLLDGTFLSSVLVFIAYYQLWRLSRDPSRSILPLTFSVLALVFARSSFQWPALVVFALSLSLIKVPFKKIAIFALITGGLFGAYVIKQHIQFDMTSTYGYRGLGVCRAIGVYTPYDMGGYHAAVHNMPPLAEDDASLPPVLTQRFKASGTPNFNYIGFLKLNQDMVDFCYGRMLAMSPKELLNAYRFNAAIYFTPSIDYITRNVITDRLPWRTAYNTVFSAPALPALLALALVISATSSLITRGASPLGLLLPGLYIMIICIIGERGENMRLKLLLEPVMYVLIVSQLYRFIGTAASLCKDYLRKVTTSTN